MKKILFLIISGSLYSIVSAAPVKYIQSVSTRQANTVINIDTATIGNLTIDKLYAPNLVISPVNYNNCVGNGVVDCSTGIQTAIAVATTSGGGIVYFPPGLYMIGKSVVVYSSVTLAGAAYGSVTWKATPGMNDRILQNQARLGYGTDYNITIRDIIFDESGRDTAVTFARVNNLLMERCTLKNGSSGLFLLTGSTYDDNHHCYFVDCIFDSSNLVSGGTDINDWGNGYDIQIIRCKFIGGYTNSGNPQISAAGMRQFIIKDSWFDGQSNAAPISILGINGGGIYNSEIFNSDGFGIKVSKFTEGTPDSDIFDFVIDGNKIHDNGDYGIWLRQETNPLDTPRNLIIKNNHIQRNGKNAFNIEVASGLIVSNNFISENSKLSTGTYYAVDLIQTGNDSTGLRNIFFDGNIFADTQTIKSQTKIFQLSYVNGFRSKNNQFLNSVTTYTVNAGTTDNIKLLDGDNNYYVGSLSRDLTTASGNVTYTGTSFTPTALEFFQINTSSNSMSWGFDDGSNAHSIIYISSATSTMDSVSGYSIVVTDASGSNRQRGYVSSFGLDQFTITWEKTGSPTGSAVVKYKAQR